MNPQWLSRDWHMCSHKQYYMRQSDWDLFADFNHGSMLTERVFWEFMNEFDILHDGTSNTLTQQQACDMILACWRLGEKQGWNKL